MAKRNIEVKEAALIDRLNSRVDGTADEKKTYEAPKTFVWDNHGPIQFEEEDTKTTKVEVHNDDWKDDYFKGKEIKPMEVSLTPRNDDGTPVKGVEEWDNPLEDNRDSRAPQYASPLPLGKIIEMEYNRLMKRKVYLMALKKALAEIKDDDNEDTQLRTPNKEKDYEYVNHPKHYNNYDIEVIDMMEKIFGLYDTYAFCKLNAYKYRMRAGTKPNITIQQDLDKEKWYLTRAEEIKSRMTDTDRERATEFSKKLEK